ncbi:MAG: hypothetical protein RR888_02915 [Akkermansia sp.]
MKLRLPHYLLCSLVIALGASSAFAKNIIKNGTLGDLNTTGVWTGGVLPGAGDIVKWDSSSAWGTAEAPLHLGAATSWSGISVSLTGTETLFIGGDTERKTLTLGTSGITFKNKTSSSLILDANVIANGNQNWTASTTWQGSNVITIKGDLSGTGNITTNSGGGVQLIVEGNASNYTGTLTLDQWTNANFKNGLTGGNITMMMDTQLHVTAQGNQTYSHNLSTSGYNIAGPLFHLAGGHLTMTGNNTLATESNDIPADRYGFKIQADTGATLSFTTGTTTFKSTLLINGGGNIEFAGTTIFNKKIDITGDGTTVTLKGNNNKIKVGQQIKIGKGTTLDLSSANLYYFDYTNTANAVIIQGTLKMADFRHGGSLNQLADYSQNRILDGGTIDITGNSHESGVGITITNLGGQFLMSNEGQTLTLSGNANDNTFKFSGDGLLKIGGAGNIILNGTARSAINGTGTIEKIGSGTLTLNAASNDFAGAFILSDGKLIINHENALGSADIVNLTYAGGTLDLGNKELRNVSLKLSGTTLNSILNGTNFLGLVNIGTLATYDLSSAPKIGSGFTSDALTTDFTLSSNLILTHKADNLINYLYSAGSLSMSGSDFDFSVTNYGANKGVISAAEFSFHDMGNITFNNNVANDLLVSSGAVNAISGALSFLNVGNITFSGNKATGGQGTGGAISSAGDGSINTAKDILFENNSATLSGGAIATMGNFSFANTGAIKLLNNKALAGNGGAIQSWGAISFDNATSLTVTGNTSTDAGGALYAVSDVTISNITGDTSFNTNSSTAGNGGAISSGSSVSLTNLGNVTFTGNSAYGDGGAICAYNDITLSNIGMTTFRGNSAEGNGGALSGYNVTISGITGNVLFENNTAALNGGAIYAAGALTLLADGGNITFKGNTSNGTGHDAIYFQTGSSANLDALAGKTIEFNDSWGTDMDNIVEVAINAGLESTGTVRMSGANSQSNIKVNTTIHQGSFIVENGAQYGYYSPDWASDAPETKTTFTGLGGNIIVGSSSSINANVITLTNTVLTINEGGILRAETINLAGSLSYLGTAGQGATLVANTVNITTGLTLNFNNQSIIISAANLALGGRLTLDDASINYADNLWDSNQSFTLITFVDTPLTTGNFDDIISGKFGGSIITGEGYWGFNWTNNQLVASWTADSGAVAIPESSTVVLISLAPLVFLLRRRRK